MGLTLNEHYTLEPSIFDGLQTPTFYKFVNELPMHKDGRQFLENNIKPQIMLQCGEFETTYYIPEDLKQAITVWSEMRVSNWFDLAKTVMQDYELLHNYDRTEEWTETRKTTGTANSNSEGESESASVGTDENLVSAYDMETYSPKDKRNFENGGNGTYKTTNSGNNSIDDAFTRKVRAFGNIGVTTAQQMLEEERKLALFNVVQFIVDDFKKFFCILVY